jgi:MFS family permease
VTFASVLHQNRNLRYLWLGQVVSEIGDHFNNIAVLSLALRNEGAGMAVAGIMLARALPAISMGPLAGVMLDRFDRRKIMIASDLVRVVIALLFLLVSHTRDNRMLYVLSALLMIASPFFSAGRGAILPTIAGGEQLSTATSLTQTTMWCTTAVGAWLAGRSVDGFGFGFAFALNAFSFLFSGWCVWMLRGEFRVKQTAPAAPHPVRDYIDGLRYMRSIPLLFAIGLISLGWATGGGAAQILFSLFGEKVFNKGAAGTGDLWGAAGLGLVLGGIVAHALLPRLRYAAYKHTIAIAYILHGGMYIVFSQMTNYSAALIFILLSRAAVAVSSVMNATQVMRHTADEFRGRVMSTLETLTWGMMMLSMSAAGLATADGKESTIRLVALVSGVLSSSTAVWWTYLNLTGRLPEPPVTEPRRSSDVAP